MADAKLLSFPGRLSVSSAMADRPSAARDEAGAALARQALAGDRAAWQTLIERHNRRVVVSLLARGVPIERARELAQETWLKLIERQREWRLDRLELPGLALAQAAFLAADELRRHQRTGNAFPPADRVDPAPNALARAIDRERLSRLARALEACPAGARRVFEFVYAHPELDYGEASRRLGLSAQRTKQIVCEVRARLRAAVDEETPP